MCMPNSQVIPVRGKAFIDEVRADTKVPTIGLCSFLFSLAGAVTVSCPSVSYKMTQKLKVLAAVLQPCTESCLCPTMCLLPVLPYSRHWKSASCLHFTTANVAPDQLAILINMHLIIGTKSWNLSVNKKDLPENITCILSNIMSSVKLCFRSLIYGLLLIER